MLWILSAGHSWAGMRRAPDGGFCGGLLLSLLVSRLSSSVINESFTAFSPSPFMDFVTKGYQRAWCL